MASSPGLVSRTLASELFANIRQNSYFVHCMAPSKNCTPKTRRGSWTMQFLTQEEPKRLPATINDKRDKALFLLAYRHGLRASEIGLLQRTDVDLKQGRITIHRLKGSVSGIYPLQPDVIKRLRMYLRAYERLTVSVHHPTAACPSIGARCGAPCRPTASRRASHWRSGSSIASSTRLPRISSTRVAISSLCRIGSGTRIFRPLRNMPN
jgi:integrase